MLDEPRHYRLPGTRVGIRVAYVLAVAGMTAVCVDYVRNEDSVSILLLLALAVVAIAMVVWFERVSIMTGLEECQEGFRDRRNFGSRVLRLEEVERFDHRRELTLDRVYALLRDGRGLPILGLQQGQRVIWNGGETRDIVAELNDRLEYRRRG